MAWYIVVMKGAFIWHCTGGRHISHAERKVHTWVHPDSDLETDSVSRKASYYTSQSLEAARSGVKMLVSLWNLTGASAAMLPSRLPNFRAMGNSNRQFLVFETLQDLTTRRLTRYWIALWITCPYFWIWYQLVQVNMMTTDTLSPFSACWP